MSNALPPRFMIVERRPDRRGWRWLLLSLAWVASVALAWLWASERAAPRLGEVSVELAETRERLGRQQAELRELRQRNATLVRSDQISRAANLEVQRELAQRELEIGELREDVAFYDRLGGATAKPRGLTVHSAKFVPESGGTWRYVVMLTQNLNRGAISSGRLQLSIEGVRDGKLATLGWDDLHQRRAMPPQDYAFRYFQQLEGSVMLPPDFTPQRVRVSLRGEGAAVDQTMAWTGASATGDT